MATPSQAALELEARLLKGRGLTQARSVRIAGDARRIRAVLGY